MRPNRRAGGGLEGNKSNLHLLLEAVGWASEAGASRNLQEPINRHDLHCARLTLIHSRRLSLTERFLWGIIAVCKCCVLARVLALWPVSPGTNDHQKLLVLLLTCHWHYYCKAREHAAPGLFSPAQISRTRHWVKWMAGTHEQLGKRLDGALPFFFFFFSI
jgi:hypothetical protein